MMTQNEIAAEAAAAWWAERLMRGDRQKFIDSLKANVLADLNDKGRCYLECDYDPHGHLLTAVRAAGLECGGFMFSARGILPQKHDLDVQPTKMEPKEGYGNWTAPIILATTPPPAAVQPVRDEEGR